MTGRTYSRLVLLAPWVLALVSLFLAIEQASAGEYTIVVTNLYTTPYDHCNFDDGDDEEWVWKFEFPLTGATKCFSRSADETVDANVQYSLEFTTSRSSAGMNIEYYEKDGNGDMCTYEDGDDGHDEFTYNFDLTKLAINQTSPWDARRKSPGSDCYQGIKGYIARFPDTGGVEPVPGSPRINSANLTIVAGQVHLSIEGRNLDPDDQEPPTIQISGVEAECKASTIVKSNTNISCDLVPPETDKVSNLQTMQVMVQTPYGATRNVPIYFPRCAPACNSENGTCYWSQEQSKLECVCKSYLNYGPTCDSTYPDGIPILQAVSPIGGDYTKEIVIGVSGRVFADDDSTITDVICEVSYSGSNQRLDPTGTRIITTREVIWNGSVIPYDNRNIPQTDSLQVKGMCIIPAGAIPSLRDDKKNAVVTLIWKRGVTNQMIESVDQRTFYLYGAFDKDSSIVQMVTNPADTEKKVFRDQYLRVIVLDAKGNNRVGGEDADLFFVEWFDGPSSEPRFGIKGGVTKNFKYAKCRTNTNDNTCAYYEITQSFDFAGQFKANVFTTNPSTLNLDKINKGDLVFDIKGLGEVALPVPPPLPSSISWADQLKDRSKIAPFSKSLGQLVSPNTGARDKANVLAPLFKRWKGGWFSQRQTVSLGFETGMSKLMLGSVHVIRGQGITEDQYCDAHTDELDAGALNKQLKAWERTGNVPHTFPLIGSGFSDGDCVTSITVVIELVHRNPNSVGFTLSRTGMPNTSPRAKNITTDIVLKVATENSASTGSGVPSPVVFTYSSGSVAGLTNLRGLPAVADWKLVVDSPSERGHIKDWYINVQTEYCLKSSVVDNSICGDGGGQFYARAANVEDTLRLECPQGGVISEIQWARFGKLDGSCELNNVQVYDDCEADPALVMSRVARECVGYTSCDLNAIDTEFGAVQGEPYLCPGQLPPCPDDVSALVAEDSSSSQSKRGLRSKRKETTWLERELPSTYPGTEDYYYKTTHIRHYSEPFIRARRANDAPTCSYNSQRPKKALMVKAVCKDSNAAFTFTDTTLQAKKMLVASAAADFDNDWKDETVTLFGYEMGPLHASFTFIQGGKPVTTVYKNIQIGGQPVVLGGQIEVQSGDFDNDGYPELVIGFTDSTGALKLYLWDLAIDDSKLWGAAAKNARTNLQPCGCWNTGNIITRTFDEASPISVPTNPTFPVMVGSARLDSPGYSFSLSSGDVALALYDYLVVSWIADAGSVSWQLYQQSEDGGLAPASSEPAMLRSLNKPHAISVQLGNFDGSGYSKMALGVVDDNQVRVYLYSIDTTEDELPMKQEKVISLYDSEKPSLWGYDASAYSRANLVLESGDVDDDGDDDIIVGFTARSKAFIYRVDAPGSGTKCRKLECMEKFGNIDFTLSAGYAKSSNAFSRSPELTIAIGNMDDTYQNEVLVALEYTSTTDASVAKIMLTSLTAQPNEDDPFSINGRHCYSGPYYQTTEKTDNLVINNMGLIVSNLYGLGYRVGQPTTVRYEGVPDLIAVINAPPTHYDLIGDDEEVIVNPGTFSGSGSFTQLSNVEGVVSSFEVTRETASAKTSSHGFQLNARIAVVFGNVDLAWQDFTTKAENNGNAFLEQIAVSRDLVASGDDVVLFTSTDKDVYKYPIVDQSGSQVGSLDVVMSSSCGEKCVQKADGRDLWWFTPDHEPFNLLTYSSRAPSDFNPVNRIMVGEKVTLGPNAHEQWVDQQSGKSQNKVSLNHTASRMGAGGGAGAHVSLDYFFAASFMGVGPQIKMPIGVEVSAGYVGRTETSDESMNAETHSASINRDASVHSYVEAINPKYAYKVQPYVYMARTGSGQEYLKVDYSAEPGYYPGVSTWWQRTYDKPDPTFNMPWWWTSFKRDRTMLTKEITSSPLFPKVGEVVEVTVTVRNKALVAVTDVSLSLWRGSPENCLDLTCLFPGRTLIGAVKVGLIPAQDKREAKFLFKHDGTNNIHATLDDKNELEELHEDNNEAYSLMFYNLRDNGYTLQTIRLSPTLTFTPVRGGTNNKFIKGYDVYATVLGDTFTRQNVLVQFWHGAVGGSGRLISTVNIPRLRGSVSVTTSYRVAVYWDTSNPNLYGEQEIYAVILHSGFDTTDDNIISQVKQKVSVSCYGNVDVCGVCGGDNSACRGCDGVPLSGKTVDVCGKCGGDGSTCCVRRPSQAKVHYFKLSTDSDSSTKRVKVGDLVIWENFLDWNVKIAGGVYDYVGAPAYSLDTLKYKGFEIQGEVPPMTLDDETVGAYLQQYLSMVTMKDHVEFDDPSAHPTPVPDSSSKYLRRSIGRAAVDELPADFDNLGLARFPGWHVERPTVNLDESRLAFEPQRRDEFSRQEGDEDLYGNEDEDDYEIVEVEASMEGICCAEPDFFKDDEDEGTQKTRKRVARIDGSVEKQLAGLLQKRSKSLRTTDSKSVSRALRAPTPVFSLRSVALSLLQKQKEQAKFLDSINTTAIELDADILMARRREATRSFYDATAHERDLLVGTDDVDGDGLDEGVHCLCARRRRASILRQKDQRDGPAGESGGGSGAGSGSGSGESGGGAGGESGAGSTTPSEPSQADKDKANSEKVDQADKLGGTSAGAGSLGAAEVGTGAEMTGTTSFGVPTFSGFGAARGWTLYDFSEITRTAANDPDVLVPGAVSAPHRFFSPGIYMWHDSNNPAIHGTIIVDPSDLLVDACGVCGGNGTTCLDCKGKPRGNARRDVCGVCYDPFVDSYDPNKAKDCAGVCNGTAKVDECGFCAGGSTGRVAGFAKDCAGVCNGTMPSLCGVCGATQDTRPDLLDCAGECYGRRIVNKCGFCVGGSSGLDVSYGMDCAGECNGTAVRDCFGLCQGTAKVDCAKVCNGTARNNKCDRCVGGATGLDDAMTKRCDGVCAITPAEVCGSNSTTSATKRIMDEYVTSDYSDSFEADAAADVATSLFDARQACTGTYDCAGVCNGTSSTDKRGTCCAMEQIDCAGLCRGSATIDCGVCVGGSSGKDSSQVRDCMGVCNGTAKYNPCGVCVTPENYYNGSGYRVDCNNVCNGSAYIDSCGKCVEGTTGRLPNVDQDCKGVCFGNATTDGCNVCYLAGDDHVPNKDMDCAGVCNGTAVTDDCGQCALGTTKKEFNADKDCAGQCFGQHIITDPACSCPAGKLDQCFVCGGNNTQCAGCDGVPNSKKVKDFCGVCGGNNTQCCFLPFAQTTVTIKDFETIVLRNELETGETLRISNLHAGYAYSLIMYRLDVPADVARVKQIQTRWDYASLRPGNSLDIIISEPGVYRITSVESSSVTFTLTVAYNTKVLDVCGRCVYPYARTSSTNTTTTTTIASNPNRLEYDHCCAIMPDNNVHDWYQTTFFYRTDVLEQAPHDVTRVVPHTDAYPTSARQHLVRLIEPHRIDSSTWWGGKKLSVGDVLTFENADSVDHVLSFSGPQPLPDVYMERGRTVSSLPLFKPGDYRLVSNKNMINTTFTVEFPFVCTVYAPEPVSEEDHTLLIALTSSLGGALVVVVLAGLVAIAAVVIYKCATRKPETIKDQTMYPL